ncbi:MAG: hypothetical protein R3E79_56230 [Caldilineaceae bacterium]
MGVQIPTVNQLYAGRPNANGYLYFDKVAFSGLQDGAFGDRTAEVRINLNDEKSSGNIWGDNISTIPAGTNPPATTAIAVSQKLNSDAGNFFLLWEDDGSSTDRDYNGDIDDNILNVEKITNASDLATSSTHFSSGGASGDLYWNLSNEFFVGTLRNLQIFNYALSPQGAARAYNTETLALQMDFDEAPGETTVVDSSGNYFTAGCAGASCPDSGIPGRDNQALRFDGAPDGLPADDDGNDGTADYLTMAANRCCTGLRQRQLHHYGLGQAR